MGCLSSATEELRNLWDGGLHVVGCELWTVVWLQLRQTRQDISSRNFFFLVHQRILPSGTPSVIDRMWGGGGGEVESGGGRTTVKCLFS